MINENLLPLFKRVATHLLTQNKKSSYPGSDGCAYRGLHSTRCAVGCLISDKAYDADLEGLFVYQPEIKLALEESGIEPTVETIDLLSLLQETHDQSEVSEWKLHLINDAMYFFEIEMNEAAHLVNSLIKV